MRSRQTPEAIADEMMPVLLDLEVVGRADRCEDLTGKLAEFRAAKPFVVETVYGDHCRVTSKGKPAAVIEVSGFSLESGDCGKIRQKHEERVDNHENNLRVRAALECGPDGKPATEPDDSVKLAAAMTLRKKLPDVVKAVHEGKLSPEIQTCYFRMQEYVTNIGEEVRKKRCAVMTHDMVVPRVTYNAIFRRAQLEGELEEWKRDHKEIVDSLKCSSIRKLSSFIVATTPCRCREPDQPGRLAGVLRCGSRARPCWASA